MKVIIGNVHQPTLDAATVTITRAMSDPVPTCSLHLKDDTSALSVVALQEILILDEQIAPNPAANLLQNPNMNPYTTNWNASGGSGVTLAQNGGGGVIATFSNTVFTPSFFMSQNTVFGTVTAGVTYMLSCTVQGSSATNVGAYLSWVWLNAANQGIGGGGIVAGALPASGSAIRYSMSVTAPTGAVAANVRIGYQTSSNTNSGSITYTAIQFEPVWFPALSYPTPFVGPGQAGAQQINNTYWIRQYRKFAGFVTHSSAGDYHGNARTLQIDAAGYAWLMSTIIVNDSFSSQTDSAIISSLLSKYLLSYGATFITTTNVVTGVTMTTFGSNWDDLRTLFDNLAAQSAFYWTVDYYWNFIYAPPGYFAMTIALICDNSATPDLVTTFPAYNFSAEMDYTQPGSTILVIGSGSNVAEVIDGATTAQNGIISGYSLPAGTSWMRKVNDSTLQSVTDCTNRGMAELLQYDYPRNPYHLTTNVELIAGNSIQVTSATDGLNATSLLIQKVQATWIGMGETLNDTWEYQADLGATNRAATHILSRLFRLANKNTSAPAISTTTLATLEKIGVVDSIDGGSLYAQAVLSDSPVGYYRLGEPAGFSITTAYDWSGNGNNGTITGGITLGQPGALYRDANTAMLFDGSTSYITLPAALDGNGFAAVTFEGWFKLSSAALSSFTLLFEGDNTDHNLGYQLFWSGTSSLNFNVGNGTTNNGASYNVSPVAGVWWHIVGTFDGTTIRLYVNATLVATAPLSGTISASASPVLGATLGHSFGVTGTIDEVAIYQAALSQSRITAHYNLGTVGHL